MKLTRYTDYGLRILIFLAVLPEGKKATIDAICDAFSLSRNHVNKIVHQLGKEGFIHTRRGKGGGFSLAMSPENINVGVVVAKLENNLQVIDCASPLCSILPACRLKGVLNEAAKAFMAVLYGTRLSDLIQQEEQNLIALLKLNE